MLSRGGGSGGLLSTEALGDVQAQVSCAEERSRQPGHDDDARVVVDVEEGEGLLLEHDDGRVEKLVVLGWEGRREVVRFVGWGGRVKADSGWRRGGCDGIVVRIGG